MTEVNNVRNQYVADGEIDNFLFDFNIFEEKYLEIYLDDKKQSSGYSVLNFNENGGEVKFDIPPQRNVLVTLIRNVEIKRTSDFQEGGAFRASVINNEFDYQVACLKQLKDKTERSMVLPPYSKNMNLSLPIPETGKAIVWNSKGDGLANSTVDIVKLNSLLNEVVDAKEELVEARDIAIDAVDKIKFTDIPVAGTYLKRNKENTSYKNVTAWDLFPILYQARNSVLETIPNNWEVQFGQLANKVDYQELYNKLEADDLIIPDYVWYNNKMYNRFSDGKPYDETYSYLPLLSSAEDKGYVVEASSEIKGLRDAYKAFNYKDRSLDDSWECKREALPSWLSIKCPTYRKLTKYVLKSSDASMFPIGWEVRGYRKDNTYKVLDVRTDQAPVNSLSLNVSSDEAFDKFMIYVTKFNSTTNACGIAFELYGKEFIVGKRNIIPYLNSASENGYIVRTSSEHPTNDYLKAFRVFDDKLGIYTAWQTNNVKAAWLSIEIPEAKIVTSYKIFHRNRSIFDERYDDIYSSEGAPTSWEFLGSNDGVNWDILDTKSNIVWEDYVPQIHDVATPNSYRFYKLDVKDNNSLPLMEIGRLELYEDLEVPHEKFRFPDLRNQETLDFPIIKIKE
jgi:hypothetical protein